MADEVEKPNKMRLSTKLGIGAMGLLTVGQLNQLKEFFTGDQGAALTRIESTQREGFDRIDRKLDSYAQAQTETHRRLFDLLTSDIVASENRCNQRNDDLKERILNLENFALKNSSRKGSNN